MLREMITHGLPPAAQSLPVRERTQSSCNGAGQAMEQFP